MNRRGFFGRMVGAIVAAKFPLPKATAPTESRLASQYRDWYTNRVYRSPIVPCIGVAKTGAEKAGDLVEVDLGGFNIARLEASGHVERGDLLSADSLGRVKRVGSRADVSS